MFCKFYFPILKKFFSCQFLKKNFDLKNLFFDGRKYRFSFSAHHNQSYSEFLPIVFYNVKQSFFTTISDEKISLIKINFLTSSNIVFRIQRITLSHILHFWPILFSNFKEIFFVLNFWRKNFDLKNWFFDGPKYTFSWSAHHAQSYSAFLESSIFQF